MNSQLQCSLPQQCSRVALVGQGAMEYNCTRGPWQLFLSSEQQAGERDGG